MRLRQKRSWKDVFVLTHPATILLGAPISVGIILASLFKNIFKSTKQGLNNAFEVMEEAVEDKKDRW